MADAAAAPADGAKKKGGGKKKLIMLLGGVVLLGGGGAAAGFYAAGSMHKEEGPKEDPNKPQLVLKGENRIFLARGCRAGGRKGRIRALNGARVEVDETGKLAQRIIVCQEVRVSGSASREVLVCHTASHSQATKTRLPAYCGQMVTLSHFVRCCGACNGQARLKNRRDSVHQPKSGDTQFSIFIVNKP